MDKRKNNAARNDRVSQALDTSAKPRPTVSQLEEKRNAAISIVQGIIGGAVLYCIVFTIYTYITRWFL